MINKWKYAIKQVCKDDPSLIENYDKAINDDTQMWVLHHRLELTLDGEYAHSKEELIRLGMYYHRPYYELIFLTKSDHQILHAHDKYRKTLSKALHGHIVSDSTREKISKKQIGKRLAKETCQKIGIANKGKEPWNKGKKGLQTPWNKGMSGTDYTSHYPNGVKNSKRAKEG